VRPTPAALAELKAWCPEGITIELGARALLDTSSDKVG
jgi:hypothetical protein